MKQQRCQERLNPARDGLAGCPKSGWRLRPLLSLCVCPLSSLPPPTGESCPENGRSPGSVSTQHSSPRSDFTYGNSTITAQAPNAGMGNATAASDRTSTPNTQPSDVIINRKESEGFGFVIISSLNRPEAAATNSESSDCFSGVSWSQVDAYASSVILCSS